MQIRLSTPQTLPRSPRYAFTLVELLAVIAIIGILAAILIPGVTSVRARAHQAECASNLRQIGMATQMYAQQNDMRLPGPLWGGQEPFFPEASTGQLLRYIGPYLDTSLVETPGSPRTRASVMLCPAFPEDIDPALARHYVLNAGQVEVNSGGFERPFGRPGGESDGSDDVPVRVMQIVNPSTAWMMKDLDQQGSPGYAGNPLAPAEPVHGNVRNTLFFDGHVEAVPVD